MTSERSSIGRLNMAAALVLGVLLAHTAVASAEPAKGSALDIPAEPLTGRQHLFGALRAPRTAMRWAQREQTSRTTPHSGPITVLCSNGFKAVLQDLAPQFEKATEHQLVIKYSVSAELRRRIEGGEPFDLAILTPALTAELIKSGRIAADTRVPLARSGMALAIRRGARKPDVRTVDSLKAALIVSQSIAFAKEGSGGIFLMALLKRFGLFEQMTPKFKPTTTGDEVSQAVSSGQAELGVLPLSEILSVPGVELAGSFPADVQDYSVMVAGIGTGAAHAASARALVEFLLSPGVLPVVEKRGMERVPR